MIVQCRPRNRLLRSSDAHTASDDGPLTTSEIAPRISREVHHQPPTQHRPLATQPTRPPTCTQRLSHPTRRSTESHRMHSTTDPWCVACSASTITDPHPRTARRFARPTVSPFHRSTVQSNHAPGHPDHRPLRMVQRIRSSCTRKSCTHVRTIRRNHPSTCTARLDQPDTSASALHRASWPADTNNQRVAPRDREVNRNSRDTAVA